MPVNRQIVLDFRPPDKVSRRQLPTRRGACARRPGPAEILVRQHYLSLDPYMRGRLNDARNPTPRRRQSAR